MHVNNITNTVSREMLKELLKKWNMTFDKYVDEKIQEDYALVFRGKK